ncbi:phosphate ABC transporter permease PstA [Jeotgalibacillus haloalkalitolerans]|uniref:Phosphate transport system permease protein PstA n=2 Tax=Jeotgalibacillus TaxID=157226 RepID=A0A0B5ARZ0_9BACL|nr:MULTISPECIES: phosphate ABC transporter permease PstA [Jeotgalibacillus]AJD91462.1 phosphate ABC transporter permease [Jeotgalibacillus malaysiensis]MDZ5712171.1 phosphate ABC transporter permease PstA [Jeotgalibacillus sp. HH7-29]
MKYVNHEEVAAKTKTRLTKNTILKGVFAAATSFGLIVLAILLYRIVTQGSEYLSFDFFTSFASRIPENSGIKAAIQGSIYLMLVVAPVSMFLGVGTAIYLEEYAKKNKFTNFIKVNISNLAGVPSVVFGLLGLTIFVRFFDLGISILAAGLTMSLLILPIIIVASQEAIRAVPNELREASFAMGATRWQTILRVVLPASIPGILTGSILALSRAIGETAPLVVIGIPTILMFTPDSIMSTFTALPMQIFDWTKRPQVTFHDVAAAGIIVLMGLLIIMNSIAVFIRNKYQKRY